MSRILVLGAGFVAGPFVRYFLARPDMEVRIGDLEPDKAAALAGAHPRASAFGLDLQDEAALDAEVSVVDVVISLVPYTFHPLVARACLRRGKHMVTTSYVSEIMRGFDAEAKAAGITILNEVGLDPGIDHMEAMRIIHGVKNGGGQVLGFTSYCGGLPAPDANTNPFGYKFSWSPRGVLMAGTNDACYLKEGREIRVPGRDLFEHYALIPVSEMGVFEGYPNRNSLPYIELYGIPETRTMFRGTFRYPGWCRTLKKISDLGFLDPMVRDLAGLTVLDLTLALLGEVKGQAWAAEMAPRASPGGRTPSSGTPDPRALLARRLDLDSDIVDRLDWLGLLQDQPLEMAKGSPLDVLERLMLGKLRYTPGERDMILLQHVIQVQAADGRGETITSTLVDYGKPGGDSSMARTVGLPAAAATRLLLEGKISRRGVLIPIHPEIYGPILTEIARFGIVFDERRTMTEK
jgi:saccharopine dehydrogenase (NADP+, L-glutamate forming)/spermidine synthase